MPDDILKHDPDTWLSTLPTYAQKRAKQLLEISDNDYETAADLWLKAKLDDTAPFGAITEGASIFKDKLMEELEKLLCGDPSYDDDRKKLLEQKPVVYGSLIVVISNIIAPRLGLAAAFLAVPIALLIISMGKVSLEAWCKTRQAQRDQKENGE